jgi:hypothetical protein
MWPVVPAICNVVTDLHIQALIFNWTYLRCYWKYLDNSMLVILQTWCQIQRTYSGLRYVYCGPGHIQYIYSSAHSDFNIHLNASALLLQISRQFNASYTANLVPNTAHILRFTLCELWSRTYTMHLQLHIFRLQYSFERICPAIVHITTIQCALHCKPGAKCSTHPTAYAMWTCVAGRIEYSYSSTYSGFNIQVNVSALLLVISRQRSARYTANMVPNIEQILQFTLSELRSRPYTM